MKNRCFYKHWWKIGILNTKVDLFIHKLNERLICSLSLAIINKKQKQNRYTFFCCQFNMMYAFWNAMSIIKDRYAHLEITVITEITVVTVVVDDRQK